MKKSTCQNVVIPGLIPGCYRITCRRTCRRSTCIVTVRDSTNCFDVAPQTTRDASVTLLCQDTATAKRQKQVAYNTCQINVINRMNKPDGKGENANLLYSCKYRNIIIIKKGFLSCVVYSETKLDVLPKLKRLQ